MITGRRVYSRFEKCYAISTGVVECDHGKLQFSRFVKFTIDKRIFSQQKVSNKLVNLIHILGIDWGWVDVATALIQSTLICVASS